MIFRHLLNMRSHPMWVRGLKLNRSIPTWDNDKSHPMWVRGLKRNTSSASRTRRRRTLCGCVD